MEAGLVHAVLGPGVEVELNKAGVVSLGELPDDVLGNGHLYTNYRG